MKVIRNDCLNRHVRMLDGQWQGIAIGSDGCVYFFAGSHCPSLGAPFFRYVPEGRRPGRIEMICRDISSVCGEDPQRVPAQGKVHSEILEHKGWLYFGTHLSDYSVAGRNAYTGGHLIGYELKSGRFRDFGVIHRNYTNYSGIGLDRARERIYFYATPFADRPDVDGPHLHRIDLRTGANEDLGLITPWSVRTNRYRQDASVDFSHGPSRAYLHVDSRGDCWFTIRDQTEDQRGLWVARGESGAIERFPDALPGGASRWLALQPLDGQRALVLMHDGAYIFDPSRFDGSPSAFTKIKTIERDLYWSSLGIGGGRFYWNCRDDKERHKTRFPVMRLFSASITEPQRTIEHGPVRDEQGRIPRGLSGIVADGRGFVYMAGRWHVREDEYDTLGVDRHGNIVAAFFTVLDVRDDLQAAFGGFA